MKHETTLLHTRAERHPCQASLLQGSCGVAGYRSYLAQMLHVHRAIDGSLRARMHDPRVAGVVREHQLRAGLIERDLAALGATGPAPPSPATRELVGAIERADVPALLGMHYVLEGSTNGGRFIARAIARSLGLAPGAGLDYLDPHGDAQRERWAAFREALDHAALAPAEQDAAVAGAMAMFSMLVGVFDAILESEATRPDPHPRAEFLPPTPSPVP